MLNAKRKPNDLTPEEFYLSKDYTGDLDIIHERLWYEFFTPFAPNKGETKRRILALYNKVVDISNKECGFQRVINLTASTHWAPKLDDSGPEMKEAIFVDIIAFVAPNKQRAKVIQMQTPVAGSMSREQIHKQQSSKQTKQPGKGGGLIEQILALHIAGKSNKEIIAAGYNKSTVGRQVSEYKKRKQN